MDIEKIEERISKKEAQIAKIEKKIEKWKNAKTVEGFKKSEEDWLARDGKWVNYAESEDRMVYNLSFEEFMKATPDRYENYLKDCDDEIRRAEYDLRDAQATLEKYHNALKAAQVKMDKLSQEKIRVIWEYLENYKQMNINYIHRNLEVLKEYYTTNSARIKYENDNGWKARRGELNKEEYTKTLNEFKKKEKSLKNLIDPLTTACSKRIYDDNQDDWANGRKYELVIDDEKLEKILDEEIDNLYLRMINQVTEKVGEITDASNLSIGAKGEINGIIIGTNGKAKIETIGAGGYNVGQIVNVRQGQRFHFRTLVHKVA